MEIGSIYQDQGVPAFCDAFMHGASRALNGTEISQYFDEAHGTDLFHGCDGFYTDSAHLWPGDSTRAHRTQCLGVLRSTQPQDGHLMAQQQRSVVFALLRVY